MVALKAKHGVMAAAALAAAALVYRAVRIHGRSWEVYHSAMANLDPIKAEDLFFELNLGEGTWVRILV